MTELAGIQDTGPFSSISIISRVVEHQCTFNAIIQEPAGMFNDNY